MKLTYLSNHAVFSTWLKCQDKNLNILRMKRALRWNKKRFHHFKGLPLKQIRSKTKQFILEGKNLTLKNSPKLEQEQEQENYT